MGKIANRKIKDEYFELVKMFPLKSIRTYEQLDEATWMLARVLGDEPLSSGAEDYADALTSLIREYEHRQPKVDYPEITNLDIIRHILDEHQFSQKQFAQILGISESAAGMILTGKRDLTKSHRAKFSARFGLPPSVFF